MSISNKGSKSVSNKSDNRDIVKDFLESEAKNLSSKSSWLGKTSFAAEDLMSIINNYKEAEREKDALLKKNFEEYQKEMQKNEEADRKKEEEIIKNFKEQQEKEKEDFDKKLKKYDEERKKKESDTLKEKSKIIKEYLSEKRKEQAVIAIIDDKLCIRTSDQEGDLKKFELSNAENLEKLQEYLINLNETDRKNVENQLKEYYLNKITEYNFVVLGYNIDKKEAKDKLNPIFPRKIVNVFQDVLNVNEMIKKFYTAVKLKPGDINGLYIKGLNYSNNLANTKISGLAADDKAVFNSFIDRLAVYSKDANVSALEDFVKHAGLDVAMDNKDDKIIVGTIKSKLAEKTAKEATNIIMSFVGSRENLFKTKEEIHKDKTTSYGQTIDLLCRNNNNLKSFARNFNDNSDSYLEKSEKLREMFEASVKNDNERHKYLYLFVSIITAGLVPFLNSIFEFRLSKTTKDLRRAQKNVYAAFLGSINGIQRIEKLEAQQLDHAADLMELQARSIIKHGADRGLFETKDEGGVLKINTDSKDGKAVEKRALEYNSGYAEQLGKNLQKFGNLPISNIGKSSPNNGFVSNIIGNNINHGHSWEL